MKQILLFCCFLPILFNAQIPDNSKRDWIWPLGYDYYTDSVGIDAITFDFSGVANGDTMKIRYGKQAFEMSYTNVSICDLEGKLNLYSNGCDMGNSDRELILNNKIINNTNLNAVFCSGESGYPGSRIGLMLPDNYDTTITHVLFTPVTLLSTGYRPNLFLYSRINKSNQEFEVIDSILIQTADTPFFNLGHLSACLHGNGLDWWVLTNLRGTNQILKFIISNKTIKGPFVQEIGVSTQELDSNSGNSVFSPDGNLFADYGIASDIKIYHFDRCSGMLSNPINIPIQDSSDIYYAAGIAFSNNSRNLYAASTFKVYQFDMQAPDIAASNVVVAEWDGFYDEDPLFPMLFYQMQLAPDNKIYMTSPGGRTNIHVIEYPDSAGLACHVTQHKYHLKTAISGGLPNFPYYRLGASNPPCAVGVEDVENIGSHLYISPNPATESLTISFPEYKGLETHTLHVTNMLGQALAIKTFTGSQTMLDVSALPAGLVYVQVLERGKIKAVGKVIIAN